MCDRAVSHLHSERGVDAMVEVQVCGAVVGPVCDPQVAVPHPTVQLMLYTTFLKHGGHTTHHSRSGFIHKKD